MNDWELVKNKDPFLVQYQPSELEIASEFLTTWLPFLSKGLCRRCKERLSNRIRSIDPELGSDFRSMKLEADVIPSVASSIEPEKVDESCDNKCHSDGADARSLGSWKDGTEELYDSLQEASSSALANSSPSAETSSIRMSWADMAQEDELEEEDEQEHESSKVNDMGPRESVPVEKPKLPRDQREYIRFMNVKRKKDFMCFERIKGKLVNIVEGLELHKGVFSAAEQKRIVDYVYELLEKGAKGELKERTYTAPQKWMRGKGRVTIQFGCCYNYAVDKNGNPPGILQTEVIDPLPHLFKVIIRRLVRWHVLPPTCVPDSCIVNIYDEGDCIPPHIDNHDFVRPFCTVSFLSECSIVFGSNLKIVGPGEFDGPLAIPLPIGSVLVLNGNGADVAKHCVPAVPTKRISITFRRMDESKRPIGHAPEPDLLGIEPLSYGEKITEQLSPERDRHARKQPYRREDKKELRRPFEAGEQSEQNYSHHTRRGRDYRPKFRVNLDK